MNLKEKVRYVYDGLKRGYDDPHWWRARVLEFLVSPIHTRLYPRRDGAVDVMDEDWDTLIVLDACRADLFEQHTNLSDFDEYRREVSRGSTTLEWVEQNFAGESYGDTVYITTNPYVSLAAGEAFHELVELWVDEFDDELNTVPPDRVVTAAKRVHEEYPDKRIVVHFMQPHHPFVPSPELQFDGWHVAGYDDWREDAGNTTDENDETGIGTPWEALSTGVVSREAVWNAYGSNLDLALDAVDELLGDIEGRVVVTSDHGNMLGERTFPFPLRVYGHPIGIRNSELVEVPWAVVQRGNRRKIKLDSTYSASSDDEETIEDRLEALGYK
jgi:hypothetical protein